MIQALFFAVLAIGAVKTGEPAPDFSLKTSSGTTAKLSDFKGKTVVLEWFNKDCPFVRKHYDSKNMQGLQKKYTEKGVQWLTIVSSKEGKEGYLTPEEAQKTIQTEGMSMTHLMMDPDGAVGKMYGAKTTPHMYVINPQGKLVYMGAIDSKKSTEPRDIASSQNYVAAAVDSVLAGKPVKKAQTESYGCSVKY